MRGEHDEQLAALRERLAWYAANQSLLTDRDDVITSQAQAIEDLRARLEAAERAGADARVPNLRRQVCLIPLSQPFVTCLEPPSCTSTSGACAGLLWCYEQRVRACWGARLSQACCVPN